MRTCVVCGRKIRTGIKYCYICRSIQKAGKEKIDNLNLDYTNLWIISLIGIFFILICLITKNDIWYVFGVIFGLIGLPFLLRFIIKKIRKPLRESEAPEESI